MGHKTVVLVGLLLTFIAPTLVLAEMPKINPILEKIDSDNELPFDGTAKVTATQQKVNEGVKTFQYIYYRRDVNKSFLIVMTSPEMEKGNGYLKQGDNYWMYRRNTRTFQHINHDESIAGSDSRVEDVKEVLTEKYQPALAKGGKEKISESKLGEVPVYQFELKAKNEDEYYAKRIYWVRRDNFLPLKVQCYSLSGTLMRTAYYVKYTPVQDKYILVKGIFVDELEKGNKTLVEVNNISTKKIDDQVFTKAHLENLSK